METVQLARALQILIQAMLRNGNDSTKLADQSYGGIHECFRNLSVYTFVRNKYFQRRLRLTFPSTIVNHELPSFSLCISHYLYYRH